MGFSIHLCYVKVSLATALARNAKRERNVPESIIREKALNIATSFELTAPHADSVVVIDNE
jgi:predicted kinase